MRCDIHAFFEIKLNGKWHTYSQPRLERNYQLFAKMANVRNDYDIEPISEPRGLPEDISEVVKFEAKDWRTDGHSYSWLNADEIAEVIEFHKSLFPREKFWEPEYYQWGFLCGNGWGHFNEYRNDYPEEIEDIHLVFWFDN
ncbi:MAG: hypothetical protein GXO75_15375 [Calditrichaeota bacterium]|nr:hypothetical protein [Calditrichota bacterium]